MIQTLCDMCKKQAGFKQEVRGNSSGFLLF